MKDVVRFIKFHNVVTGYKEYINCNYLVTQLFSNDLTNEERRMFDLLPFTTAYSWYPYENQVDIFLTDTLEKDESDERFSYNWINLTLKKDCEMAKFFNTYSATD